jgi:nucleoside-diphosphate-sugar epimerase
MDPGTILVTGGAGYIGSHVVLQLRARGERVVVLDNLSTGFRQAVLDCPLVVGNVGDRAQVLAVLREHGVDTVMHFAANTVVPESVADPLKYYGNNTCATQNLLKCCTEAGVRQFVFSSTAAVYGIPKEPFAEETTPTAPINPYGTSKLMSEWMLRDVAAATGMRYVALRYFNVAGSDSQGRIGQSTPKATLLIKVACEAVVGKRKEVCDFRHRLCDARRHGRARLHSRGGPRRGTPECARLRARRRRIDRAQLRLRTRLQRARSARERRARGRQAPARVKEQPRRAGRPAHARRARRADSLGARVAAAPR